jgi:hypothetical protein
MPYGRMGERLGLHAAALQNVATAQASQAVLSGVVATVATSNIIDSWALGERRMLVRANFTPLNTAATGNATVAIFHGTGTGAMSAASVGTGTTPMQATVAVGSVGKILDLELQGGDLVGKNRYLQAIVTPGGSLVAAVALNVITEPRILPPTGANVAQLATPVVVADL